MNPQWETLESWTRGIFCGKSLYDVADKMTKDYIDIMNLYPASEYAYFILTLDGSSHDAHQHKMLMDLVDMRIIKDIMPEALMKTEIPPDIHNEVMKRLLLTNYKIKATVPKKAHARNKGD